MNESQPQRVATALERLLEQTGPNGSFAQLVGRLESAADTAATAADVMTSTGSAFRGASGEMTDAGRTLSGAAETIHHAAGTIADAAQTISRAY